MRAVCRGLGVQRFPVPAAYFSVSINTITSLGEELPPRLTESKFKINAFYVARAVHLIKAHEELYVRRPHRCRRDFLMISFPDDQAVMNTDEDHLGTGDSARLKQGIPGRHKKKRRTLGNRNVHPQMEFGNRHMVVFDYGSVVFFNFDDLELQQRLKELRRFCVEPIAQEVQMTEDYTLIERPHLRESCVLQNDLTILKELDFHSATVISTVMAQTVALDHYSALVDQMLEIFTEFNHTVERTGQFTAIEKNDLFKMVAQNNAVLIDVISKLSLLERSDTAWKMPQYVHVWEGLREEFEVDQRFENLKFKLNLIQDNTKFFLEIMHNQKSNMLEWVIIVLISAEIVLCSMDLCDFKPTYLISLIESMGGGGAVS
uniref:DUF155 domain-containing protein n=1 Tax=Octactis speculum TaxID=3111310 RepID=A0A7S2G731_9STRA|mmetsp:Transcript_38581/g.52297  ORF Transcript_38581/g.52297 Transcript_38581/m.52297 type:complete len:374 (+) Transcript_38581:51-1172(+)|eukprot:CAMPEP_0185750090 /NCGR_PEP_ID=MMETSP1174-20130828/8811_1 /TAXON_ID=35687 /ORGANISM="Dictyocha speculum, Strain CCMP1381" /LENGTH=373 /DNA_ID=CAMNT_0028426483 /DNA_START=51 /DNA_END=1172 /DNA_ORIENTATION=+